jgi:hypothetical protein
MCNLYCEEHSRQLRRAHDLHKMRFALKQGLPVVRITSRAIQHFNYSTWQRWLTHVRDRHIRPLADRSRQERKLIALEDTPRYRQMYGECIRDDADLGPYVVFV